MNKNKHKNNIKQLQALIDSKKSEFYFGLYLLMVSYETIIDILETFCGGYINLKDQNLNYCYIQCQRQINIVLESQKAIKETLGKPPELFDSLVGNIEEIDVYWENGFRQAANDYYGKIVNYFVLKGSRKFTLPEFIQKYFTFTKQAISNHKKTNAIYYKLFGITPNKETYLKYGDTVVDLEKSTLQYKNNQPVGISLATNEIIFLVMLIKHKGEVVNYEEIIKENPSGPINESNSRKCNYLKRNLGKHLIRAGVDKKSVSKMMVAVRGVGYRIASC